MPDAGTSASAGLTPELVIAAAAEGICVVDEEGRVVFANPAAATLLGWTVDDLMGRRLHETCHHTTAEGAPYPAQLCPVTHVLRDGFPRTVESDVMWSPTHRPVAVDARVTAVYAAGRVSGAVVVLTAADSAASGEPPPAPVTDELGTALIGVDGRYLQVGERVCALLGRTEDELRTLTVNDVTHPDDKETALPALQRMLEGELASFAIEKRYVRPDGEVVHALLHTTPVRDGDDSPLYFRSQYVDVTDARRADEALRQDAERTARVVELCDLLAESTTEAGELLQDVARMVARIVGDAVAVWVVDDAALRVVSCWQPGTDPLDPAPLAGAAAARAQAVADTGDVAFDPGLVLVPLRARGRTVGVLGAARVVAGQPYTAGELALVKDIGQRIALAIDNARLLRIARAAQAAVRASDERHRALVQQSADVILILDAHGQIGYATPSTRAIFGRAPHELVESLFDLVHPDDLPVVEATYAATLAGRRAPEVVEFRVGHADGGWRVVESRTTDLLADPAVGGVVVNLRDITERRRVAEQQAAVAALGQWALSGTALDELLDAATALAARTLDLPLCGVLALVPEAEALRLVAGVGWREGLVGEATVATGVTCLSDYELAWPAPVTAGHLDGSVRFLGASLLLEHGAVAGVSVAIEGHAGPYGVLSAFSTASRAFGQADVNFLVAVANIVAAVVERRRAEEEMRHQALHDGLTGLPNRTLLGDRLEQALASSARDGNHVGLLLLDLDGFKDVNDSLGHHAGDLLLRQVSSRLRGALRASDTVARLGGDEFAVCLPDLRGAAEAGTIAGKLLAVLSAPFELVEMSVTLSASVGVAFSGEHGQDPSVLLQRADIAMYRAKRARCGWALYDTATDEAHRHRLAVLAELRDAAALGELELHYQPLIDLRTRRVEHVEALVRWAHPVRGLIPPGDFIPLAEQSGLIHPLTAWVIQSAVDQIARWAAKGIDMRVAVNLSAVVLQDDDLPAAITSALADAGLGTDRLIVEITESVIAEEGVRVALQRLADAGIQCAVDDFGTGYSSLAWLKHLPVHQLKVDRAFVTGMASDPRDRAIVQSVVTLAHSLGLQVIAEGIESEEVAGLLTTLGADIAQGFLFCRPLPCAELERWLAGNAVELVGSGTIGG